MPSVLIDTPCHVISWQGALFTILIINHLIRVTSFIGNNTLNPVKSQADVNDRANEGSTSTPSNFTFNDADGDGFIIVAGDDNMPDIVGYGMYKNISESTTMPDALIEFLQGYEQYVENYRKR